MIFIERNTRPARDNKYYNKPKAYSAKNLDMWEIGGNCTDYAWCRYREALQDMNGSKDLPTSAATRFFEDAKKKGLKTGMTPKIGAIACFNGHLAFVENVYGGKVRYSAGGHSKVPGLSYLFKIKTLNIGQSWNGKKLLGYIYAPIEFEEDLPPANCDYKVISPRYVRKGAGTEYDIKLVKECSKAVKNNPGKYCTTAKQNAKAQFKSGTIITAKKIVKAKNGSIWVECPSGFVCLRSAKGTMYCSKV